MLSKDALNVYLNDHLAGSTAAVELIEQARDHNQGTRWPTSWMRCWKRSAPTARCWKG